MNKKIIIWNLKVVENNLYKEGRADDAYTIRLALDLLSSNWRTTKNIEDVVLIGRLKVKKEAIYNFRLNLFTISMEYGDCHELDEENEEELEARELNYMQTFFESIGVEVENKDTNL